MKRNVIIAGVAVLLLCSNTVWAYWVWTPGTKKFINPKNAVKDSPKEQFEWAMTFYNAKDYQKAATEFDKLTKQYEYSEYASKAQYYVGLSYENMNKFYIAFQNYQKAIDNFPHIENMDEIVAREFNIANLFVTKESPKVLGADIMTSIDRAIEIYKRVVDNAPYGRLADEAQFRMGMAMKKAERYDEAIQALQKILDDYPTSRFADKAKFEVADCAYKASLKPAYDVEPTTKAIKAFEDFSHENGDRSLTKEADKAVQRLKDRIAEKSLITAQFYERQGRYKAAIIYYKDIIDTYPESSYVPLAKSKIEALTARLEHKAHAAPLNFTKPVVKHAESTKEAAPKTAETPKAQKKAWWNPFSNTAKAKEPESKVVRTPKPSKGLWQDLFGGRLKPKTAAPEAKAGDAGVKPSHKGWSPFSFSKPSKPKEAAPKVVKTPKPSKGLWQDLFGGRSKTKTAAVPVAAAPETVAPAAATPATVTPVAAVTASPDAQQSNGAEAKVEAPKAEEAVQKTAVIPQEGSEPPSDIKVTQDAEEMRKAEYRAVEAGQVSGADNADAGEPENAEDQVEKADY